MKLLVTGFLGLIVMAVAALAVDLLVDDWRSMRPAVCPVHDVRLETRLIGRSRCGPGLDVHVMHGTIECARQALDRSRPTLFPLAADQGCWRGCLGGPAVLNLVRLCADCDRALGEFQATCQQPSCSVAHALHLASLGAVQADGASTDHGAGLPTDGPR